MAAAMRRFKLAPKYKWSKLAPFVKAVSLQFDAAANGTVGIKEFWRQTVGPKVVAAHPKLDVKLHLTEGLEPPVAKVTFSDDSQIEIDALNKTVDDLLAEVQDHASILERVQFVPEYKPPGSE